MKVYGLKHKPTERMLADSHMHDKPRAGPFLFLPYESLVTPWLTKDLWYAEAIKRDNDNEYHYIRDSEEPYSLLDLEIATFNLTETPDETDQDCVG